VIHLFFINEVSLNKNLDVCINNIRSICENNSLEYEIITTKSISDLKSKVQKNNEYVDSVYYAVGGDGTFQSLVNAVDLGNAVLQYLPYGSGNNAYRTFYNRKFDLERDILCNDTFKADLGKANSEFFVTMFGLALDSSIGKNLSKFKRFPISGKAKYYASILYSVFFDCKPVNVKMTVDGITEEKISSFISITNGPTTGGQTPISPRSSAFDGKLNALVADKISSMQVLKLFSKVKTGKHLSDPCISQYLFERMILESLEPLMYEIDGEIHYAKRIEIEACKNAVTLKGRNYEHRY